MLGKAKKEISQIISSKLKLDNDFRQSIKDHRKSICQQAVKGELSPKFMIYGEGYMYSLNADGYFAKKSGRKEVLEKIAGSYYNKGFKEETGVDLYDFDIGDKNTEKTENTDREFYDKEIRSFRNFYAALFGVIFGLPAIGVGAAIGGIIGASIGVGVALVSTALFTTMFSAASVSSERYCAKFYLESICKERGKQDGHDLQSELNVERTIAKVTEKLNEKPTEKPIEKQKDNDYLSKILSAKESTNLGLLR